MNQQGNIISRKQKGAMRRLGPSEAMRYDMKVLVRGRGLLDLAIDKLPDWVKAALTQCVLADAKEFRVKACDIIWSIDRVGTIKCNKVQSVEIPHGITCSS